MTVKRAEDAPRRPLPPSDVTSLARRHHLAVRLSPAVIAHRITGLTPAEAFAEAIAIGYVLGYADARDSRELCEDAAALRAEAALAKHRARELRAG